MKDMFKNKKNIVIVIIILLLILIAYFWYVNNNKLNNIENMNINDVNIENIVENDDLYFNLESQINKDIDRLDSILE